MSDLQIFKTITVSAMPLLQLASKNLTSWVAVGDCPNFFVLDIETESITTINSDSGLIKGVLVRQNLIVVLCERMVRMYDMNDRRLMHTLESSNDSL